MVIVPVSTYTLVQQLARRSRVSENSLGFNRRYPELHRSPREREIERERERERESERLRGGRQSHLGMRGSDIKR